MNAPNEAGVPIVSASVAGTLPPTCRPCRAQLTDMVFDGSLSDVALSVTEPDAAAPAALSM